MQELALLRVRSICNRDSSVSTPGSQQARRVERPARRGRRPSEQGEVTTWLAEIECSRHGPTGATLAARFGVSGPTAGRLLAEILQVRPALRIACSSFATSSAARPAERRALVIVPTVRHCGRFTSSWTAEGGKSLLGLATGVRAPPPSGGTGSVQSGSDHVAIPTRVPRGHHR